MEATRGTPRVRDVQQRDDGRRWTLTLDGETIIADTTVGGRVVGVQTPDGQLLDGDAEVVSAVQDHIGNVLTARSVREQLDAPERPRGRSDRVRWRR
jgi:hypothetical protein